MRSWARTSSISSIKQRQFAKRQVRRNVRKADRAANGRRPQQLARGHFHQGVGRHAFFRADVGNIDAAEQLRDLAPRPQRNLRRHAILVAGELFQRTIAREIAEAVALQIDASGNHFDSLRLQPPDLFIAAFRIGPQRSAGPQDAMANAVRVVIVVQQVVTDPPRGNRVAQGSGQRAGRRDTAPRHLVDQPSQREDQIGDGRKGVGHVITRIRR